VDEPLFGISKTPDEDTPVPEVKEVPEKTQPETTATEKTVEPVVAPEPAVEEKPTTTPDSPSEDLPDWLQGDVSPQEKTQFTDDLKKMEDERKKELEAS